MKTKLWKRFLPFFMSLVMLFSAVAGVIPAVAEEISATEKEDEILNGGTGEDFYYKIVFEDGVLRLQLNPQKVYQMLKERNFTREELLKFIPEDVQATLEKGRDISLDDIQALASNYIPPEELKKMIPQDLIEKYFTLEAFEEIISINDLLEVVSLDEILANADQDAITKLLSDNEEVFDILLDNKNAVDAVLNNGTFVEDLLDNDTFIQQILALDSVTKDLAGMIKSDLIDKLLEDYPDLDDAILGEIDESELLASDEAKDALKEYFSKEENKDIVFDFLTHADVIIKLKSLLINNGDVRNALLTNDIIKQMIDPYTGVLTKEDIRALFTNDEDLKKLINDSVIKATLESDGFIDKVLATENAELFNKIATEELISELFETGHLDTLDPADFVNNTYSWDELQSRLSLNSLTSEQKEALADALFDKDAVGAWVEWFVTENPENPDQKEPTEEDIFNQFKENITVSGIMSAINENTVLAPLADKFTFSNLRANGIIDESKLSGDTVKNTVKTLLSTEGAARTLIVNSITANPNIVLRDYWELVDFTALAENINVEDVKALLDADEDLRNNLIDLVTGEEKAGKFNAILKNALRTLDKDVLIKIFENNADAILEKFTINDTFFTKYGFNKAAIIDAVVGKFGGYFGFMEEWGISIDFVVQQIGGYQTLLDEKYSDYISPSEIATKILNNAEAKNIVLNYVVFDDIVGAFDGGYGELLGYYSDSEIQAIFNAIGNEKLQAFLTESGILEKLDIQQILTDLLEKIDEEKKKELINKIKDTIITIFNTEIESIYINNTEIGRWGRYNFEAIAVGILQAIPDVPHFLAMKEGDVLAQWILRIHRANSETVHSIGFAIEFVGDFTQLQELVSAHADTFVFDVSDELDLTISTTIPAVAGEVYEKLLLSDRIPTMLKQKLLTAPSMSINDFADFLLEMPDEDLQKIADTVIENADKIRDKVYPKLDATVGSNDKIESAKLKVDQILDLFQDLDKLKAARTKAVALLDRIPAALSEKTISSFYVEDSVFHLNGEAEKNFYEQAISLLEKAKVSREMAENLLLIFNSDLTIGGTLDLTVKTSNVYQLSVVDESGEVHLFYLPAGFDLTELRPLFPSLASAFEDGAVMPAQDTRLGVTTAYTVHFYLDGELFDTRTYFKGEIITDLPTIPDKAGYYTPEWPKFELGDEHEFNVYATYTQKPFKPTITGNSFGIKDEDVPHYDPADEFMQLPIPDNEAIAMDHYGYEFDTWYIDVNENGKVDDGDIRLTRIDVVRMFRMLRSTAPQMGQFALPEGVAIPTDPKIVVGIKPIEHTLTFTDENGNLITDANGDPFTATYNIFEDAGTIASRFPTIPTNNGYQAVWYVGDTLWTSYNYYQQNSALELSYKIELIEYEIVLTDHQGNVLLDKDGNPIIITYTVEDEQAAIKAQIPSLPDTPEGYEVGSGAWYVIGEDGSKILLENYTFSLENATVQAIYTPTVYTITFNDGTNSYTYYFTIETEGVFYADEQLTVLAAEPSARIPAGYEGRWADYDLSILGNKTVGLVTEPTWYTITFNDGTNVYTYYFNIENKALYESKDAEKAPIAFENLPLPAERKGYAREWEKPDFNTLDDQALGTVDTPRTYDVIFEDADGNKLEGEEYKGFTYTVETNLQELINSFPKVPERNGYTGGEWTLPTSLDIGGMTIRATNYQTKTYSVEFVFNGSTVGTSSYTAFDANTSLTPPTISDVPSGYKDPVWMVVKVNGKEIDPVSLNDFKFADAYGDIVIELHYTAIEYVAIFYNENGEVVETIIFTMDDGLTLPKVPAKTGYTGAWAYDGLKPENMDIHAVYTPIPYSAVFYDENGNVIAVLNFTVEDDVIQNMPKLPRKAGHRGLWYVIAVDGKELSSAVRLDSYDLTNANITVEARYNPQKSGESPSNKIGPAKVDKDFGWIWWIVLAIVLILIILALLWFLKKKNLPPFKTTTPPAIVEAAIPEEEEEVEEEKAEEAEATVEVPIVPPVIPTIEVVESIDVQTADETMTDDVAMAVVETVEVTEKEKAGQRVIVNIHVINDAFEAGAVVDLASLKAKKLIPAKAERVKILADGTLDKPLTVIADAFSVQAIKMITLTGGHAIQKKYHL